MNTVLMPVPKQQYFAIAGIPLVGGSVYTFAAGTTTPKPTYSDAAGTVEQENPIKLNARGEPANAIYWSGNYRVVVRDAIGNLIYTVDNYNTDPSGTADKLAALAGPSGSSLIGFEQDGAGAVDLTVQDVLRETVSVKRFGAKGDGITDDTAAIQKALATGAATVTFPPGRYVVTDSLIPFGNQTLLGMSYPWNEGTILLAGQNMDKAIVKFTAGGKIKDMSILGSATASTTKQYAVYVNNTNKVIVDGVFIAGAYHGVHIDGTSFYISLRNSTFDNAYEAQLYVDSNTDPGVDLIMSHCRFLGLLSAPYCMFLKGLGSMIASDVQCSVNNVSGATLWLEDPAPRYGGLQMTNVVLENGDASTGVAVYFRGVTRPWNNARFTNCIINGAGGDAIKIANTQTTSFISCNLISISDTGVVYVPASGQAQVVNFIDCNFDGDAGVTPIQCAAPVSISMKVSNCYWGGAAPFIDFTAAAIGQITAMDVIGGSLGTNATPVRLPQPTTIPGLVDFGQLWTQYSPSLASGGGALGSATATGYYFKRGSVVHFQIAVSVSSVGTATGFIAASLPMGCVTKRTGVGYGRDVTASGKMLQGLLPANGNVVQIFNYDGSGPASNGSTLVIEGVFENA